MSSLNPRVVIVTRSTEYAALLEAHATRGQAEFFLRSRGQDIAEVEARDVLQQAALAAAKRAVPPDWSFAHVTREDLSRFLFADNDIVVALGQDGLVANLAKYLDGQPVIGISPDPERTEGILTPGHVAALPQLLSDVSRERAEMISRTMVQAETGEGMVLRALNELFVGHRSHQSARYDIMVDGQSEFQSSSGIIIATGTGLTGWARSIMTATDRVFSLEPNARTAAFFAREPWPSRTSGCAISAGVIDAPASLTVRSHINEGGVIFADGIEDDFLPFNWGVEAQIGISRGCLNMVICH